MVHGVRQRSSLKPSVVILTFNSAESLPATLGSLTGLSDDVHVVDSGSVDDTIAIAERWGAKVISHPFESYGAQRNWAIGHVALRYEWQLHLDADERLTPELHAEIVRLAGDVACDGFLLPRLVCFLGRTMRHGGMSPTWHMRLFRTGSGRCEEREYDQHFLCSGPVGALRGMMIDDVRMSIAEWTARHNRWADAEVRESLREKSSTAGPNQVQGKIAGGKLERKRYLRNVYNDAPLFVRPFGLWIYRYFLRAGFLDGVEGLIFWTLQTFWFRFLIDAKIYEARRAKVRERR